MLCIYIYMLMTETFKHTRAITFEINSRMTIVYDMFAVRALHD